MSIAWYAIVLCRDKDYERFEFVGDRLIDHQSGRLRVFYPSRRRLVKQCAGGTIGLTILGLVCACYTGLMVLKNNNEDDLYISAGVSAANGVAIALGNILYSLYASYVTVWENYDTQGAFAEQLARRTFLFQFVNSYIALFWMART